ncbi:DUF2793 domain-containing protein [Polycladidibacter hongkongensis]|uniref:DUF2793 domain-containing protein n=1 Tax=Polycladidibacter hongkongensis TaxID=1647556 RepID=UPI00083300BC|nr:DUF2793 domain-containing protein [Pseudovibrio hongkongensis]
MDKTQKLALPMIAAAQAQKHVTHNEALFLLDQLVQLAALSASESAPPADVAAGSRYLVPEGGSGAFAGAAGKIAVYDSVEGGDGVEVGDGVWLFLSPQSGWRCWVEDEAKLLVYHQGAWQEATSGGDGGNGSLPDFSKQNSTVVSGTAHGAASSMVTVEEELTLAGASVASSAVIPARAIVFCVSVRTTRQIEGASAFDCGIAGEPAKFGGSLSKWLDSTNAGVIGPTAFYSDTPVVLTAKGGAFTSGKVRLALHYFLPTAPQS